MPPFEVKRIYFDIIEILLLVSFIPKAYKAMKNDGVDELPSVFDGFVE